MNREIATATPACVEDFRGEATAFADAPLEGGLKRVILTTMTLVAVERSFR
jgi:hypothetical protein